ncbi:hypothetical protein CDD83_10146 [Cordyceps sp. RAO-2017]|nr:hypothetical protein CDD83_10146 [Cordyceps sp. RAO-2017]
MERAALRAELDSIAVATASQRQRELQAGEQARGRFKRGAMTDGGRSVDSAEGQRQRGGQRARRPGGHDVEALAEGRARAAGGRGAKGRGRGKQRWPDDGEAG